MRIIDETQTVRFKDDDGSTLVLFAAPRQRDVLAVAQFAIENAYKNVASILSTGISMDDALAFEAAIKANISNEEKAEETADEPKDDADSETEPEAEVEEQGTTDSPDVRREKFRFMAVEIVVGDQSVKGSAALLKAYDEMDSESVAWVDAKVAEVWDSATVKEKSFR